VKQRKCQFHLTFAACDVLDIVRLAVQLLTYPSTSALTYIITISYSFIEKSTLLQDLPEKCWVKVVLRPRFFFVALFNERYVINFMLSASICCLVSVNSFSLVDMHCCLFSSFFVLTLIPFEQSCFDWRIHCKCVLLDLYYHFLIFIIWPSEWMLIKFRKHYQFSGELIQCCILYICRLINGPLIISISLRIHL